MALGELRLTVCKNRNKLFREAKLRAFPPLSDQTGGCPVLLIRRLVYVAR